jgi:hypothetical protein
MWPKRGGGLPCHKSQEGKNGSIISTPWKHLNLDSFPNNENRIHPATNNFQLTGPHKSDENPPSCYMLYEKWLGISHYEASLLRFRTRLERPLRNGLLTSFGNMKISLASHLQSVLQVQKDTVISTERGCAKTCQLGHRLIFL